MLADIYPSLTFFIMVVVAPFTPQAPGVTESSKSFEVSVSSVSSKFEGLVLSLGGPSAVCDNLCPLVRFIPQVQVSKSSPTHPRFAVYAPTAFP